MQDFSGISTTSHGCYSDIPIFWNAHLLEAHLWPYKTFNLSEVNQIINPVEYPFLTGFIMWLISYMTPLSGNTDGNFFIINIIFIGALFISCFLILNKLKPKSHQLILFAPAVVFSLFINWDMWAVFTLLISFYFFESKKFSLSAIFIAIAISFKFFPIVLLPLFLLIGIKNNNLRASVTYVGKVFVFFALINAPAAIYNFNGWFYFYRLSSERMFGSGSFWEILKLAGFDLKPNNFTFITLTFIIFVVTTYYILRYESRVKLSQLAYFFVFVL